MSRYEKTFHSTSGQEFRADVYSVLEAFGVTCPARQHAIKKLLMPGQRGAKSTVQDLDEALVSVSRAIDMVRAGLPEGGTLTGETEVEPEPVPVPVPELKPSPEPEPKPKPVMWRRCVPVEHSLWIESGQIPSGWVALEAHTQPVETVRQLPEGQKP